MMRSAPLFCLLLCTAAASAFSPPAMRSAAPRGDAAAARGRRPPRRASLRRCTVVRLAADSDPSDEPSPDPNYSIDWDTAWQKEISAREQGTTGWRPEGREPVSEQAVREAKLEKIADDAQANLQMAAGDWKLWVGLLAVISVATAFAGHSPSGGTYSV